MCDELRRRLLEHPRPRRVERERGLRRNLRRRLRGRTCRRRRHPGHAVESQPPDPAVGDDLVELILLDLPPQVRSGPRPVTFLDDAVVHVGDVDRAIGRRRDVDRPEQRIGAGDELRSGIHVAQLRQPFVLDDARAADQSADRLGDQQIAAQVRRARDARARHRRRTRRSGDSAARPACARAPCRPACPQPDSGHTVSNPGSN